MAGKKLWTLDTLVETYKQHQRRTRGLREKTLENYTRIVRLLVRSALGEDPIDPTRLGPADVVRFVTAMTGRYSTHSMKAVRTALRSFFRFLRFEGVCDERLEVSIPAVAHWRLSTLPLSLNDQELKRVIASSGMSTKCGHRNRAIVLCLSTLGIRPGELADLHLEDIDWRHSTVQLRTRKTRHGAVLPLPHEAGRAIVDYLCEERPKTEERRVFVQHLGPRHGEPITSNAVSAVVVRVLERAEVDVPLAGASVFRHTVASRMVRRGTSLKAVADFLGHRCLDTTTIYAKLDLPALRDVALPWPEVL